LFEHASNGLVVDSSISTSLRFAPPANTARKIDDRIYIEEMVIGTQLRSGDFVLFQNFPNPFNPETWIPYKLDVTADVEIRIYNVNGQLIRNLIFGKQVPGTYLIKGKAAYWNGLNNYGEQVSSGIYFYQFLANDKKSGLKKMVILR
jgi:hypothetical protein